MSERGLISDYLLIRQTQAMNSLRKTLTQSECLSNSDAIINILVNMEITFRNLAEDMMLLMPLENSSTWDLTFQQIVKTIHANINEETIFKETVLCNWNHSKSKLARGSRTYEEIPNMPVTRPPIPKRSQPPKGGNYENWPMENIKQDEHQTRADIKHDQPDVAVEKKPKKVTFRLFSPKCKSSSTFYVDLDE